MRGAQMKNHNLPKYRMIQIVTVLAILITAFTWRTYEYHHVTNISCSASPNCTIKTLNQIITISALNNTQHPQIRTYKLFPILESWQYTTNGSPSERNRYSHNDLLQIGKQTLYLSIDKGKPLVIELNKTIKITISD
jgi:hypothetical protein